VRQRGKSGYSLREISKYDRVCVAFRHACVFVYVRMCMCKRIPLREKSMYVRVWAACQHACVCVCVCVSVYHLREVSMFGFVLHVNMLVYVYVYVNACYWIRVGILVCVFGALCLCVHACVHMKIPMMYTHDVYIHEPIVHIHPQGMGGCVCRSDIWPTGSTRNYCNWHWREEIKEEQTSASELVICHGTGGKHRTEKARVAGKIEEEGTLFLGLRFYLMTRDNSCIDYAVFLLDSGYTRILHE
jgi:hypothetical protein